jgi:hypothetical protein
MQAQEGSILRAPSFKLGTGEQNEQGLNRLNTLPIPIMRVISLIIRRDLRGEWMGGRALGGNQSDTLGAPPKGVMLVPARRVDSTSGDAS